MHVTCRTFWLPKEGNTAEEYEDAAAPLEPFDSDVQVFKCAVADGATETSFARLWAQLLVKGYVEGSDPAVLQGEWQQSLTGKTLPWYAEQKAESGAFAALVGLTLRGGDADKGGTWTAEAIGDSCLIQVRDGRILAAFPLNESEQFNSTPVLYSSNPKENDVAEGAYQLLEGTWLPKDRFYLMSDAIARWTFKRQEEHGDALGFLQGIKSQNELDQFAATERHLLDADSRPYLRNDDVTLMRISVKK
jgi:hypothetical protein